MRSLFVFLLFLLSLSQGGHGRVLDVNTLLTGTSLAIGPVNNTEFVPQSFIGTCDPTSDNRPCWSNVPPSRVNLDGVITISDFANAARHKFNLIWVDTDPSTAYPQPFDSASSPRRYLPPFSYQYYQKDNDLIPEVKGFQTNNVHPYWEYILSPSKCWTESADGLYDRCVIVFAITEKGQNCVYNGFMTFLVHSQTLAFSQVWYQITNSYCSYYQWDNCGFASISFSYDRNLVRQSLTVAQFYVQQSNWLPVKSITQLTADVAAKTGTTPKPPYNLLSNPFNFYPDHSECSPANPYVYPLGLYGVIYDGNIYQGISATRTGPHPYAQYTVYPHYSWSKSNFVSMVAGSLIDNYQCSFPSSYNSPWKFGTSCLLDLKVGDWVAESTQLVGRNTGPNTDWKKVSLRNLIDMADGFYDSTTHLVDEGGLIKNINFFYGETYASKMNFSLNGFSNKINATAPPGSKFVYHSSSFFIAARMLELVIAKTAIFANGLQDYYQLNICTKLKLSPSFCKMRVTNDAVKQPFGGYGLFAYLDDIGKLARFWTFSNEGSIDGSSVVDSSYYKQAMQITSYGLATSRGEDPNSTCYPVNRLPVPGDKYGYGFWTSRALNLTNTFVVNYPGCATIRNVFESGFGGLGMNIANQAWAFFQLNDNYDFRRYRAVAELNNLIGCSKNIVN